MATNSYPYNPYNAYKKIVSAKGDWHTAKQLGNDPNQYYQAAIPYYQELYDNGYGELANDLTKSDYTAAKGLRDKYGLKPDEQFNLDYDYAQISGNGQKFPFTQNTDEGKLLNAATGYDEAYQKLIGSASDIATGNTAPSLSPGVANLLDKYMAGNDRLNGEIRYDENGNVVSGLNTEHYNIGRDQLERINDFDVTKQPYYQGIMDQYRLGGQNAADNAYASGAASNGGNIDSYAAANANRQQLAFTTAGQQAALAAAQQNAQNWQTLYAQMSQDLKNQGTIDLGVLQQAANLYSVDAQERMNALDTSGALAQQTAANALNAYLAKIADDTQRYGIDAQTAMNSENNRAALEQLIARLASDERINTENNQTARYQSDNALAGTRYQSDNALAGTRYQADTGLAATRYQTDAQRDIAAANNSASYNELLASLEGQKALAGMNNQASYDQLMAQLTGQKELAGYDRDTQIKLANLASRNAIKQQEAQYELAQKYQDSTPNFDKFNEFCISALDAFVNKEGEFKEMTWDQFKAYLAKTDKDIYNSAHKDYLEDFYKMYKPQNDFSLLVGNNGNATSN